MTKQDVVENAKCDLKTFFNCTYSFWTFVYGFGSGFSVADPDFRIGSGFFGRSGSGKKADPDKRTRIRNTKKRLKQF